MAPQKTLKTYGRKPSGINKSTDVFDALFARNLKKRIKSRKPLIIKELPKTGPTLLQSDSFNIAEDTFDKLRNGTIYNLVNFGAERELKKVVYTSESDVSKTKSCIQEISNTFHSPVIVKRTRKRKTENVNKNLSDIVIRKETSLDKPVEISLEIEKENQKTENSVSYIKLPEVNICNTSRKPLETLVFDANFANIFKKNVNIYSSTPVVPSKKGADKLLKKSYEEISRWYHSFPDDKEDNVDYNKSRSEYLMKLRPTPMFKGKYKLTRTNRSFSSRKSNASIDSNQSDNLGFSPKSMADSVYKSYKVNTSIQKLENPTLQVQLTRLKNDSSNSPSVSRKSSFLATTPKPNFENSLENFRGNFITLRKRRVPKIIFPNKSKNTSNNASTSLDETDVEKEKKLYINLELLELPKYSSNKYKDSNSALRGSCRNVTKRKTKSIINNKVVLNDLTINLELCNLVNELKTKNVLASSTPVDKSKRKNSSEIPKVHKEAVVLLEQLNLNNLKTNLFRDNFDAEIKQPVIVLQKLTIDNLDKSVKYISSPFDKSQKLHESNRHLKQTPDSLPDHRNLHEEINLNNCGSIVEKVTKDLLFLERDEIEIVHETNDGVIHPQRLNISSQPDCSAPPHGDTVEDLPFDDNTEIETSSSAKNKIIVIEDDEEICHLNVVGQNENSTNIPDVIESSLVDEFNDFALPTFNAGLRKSNRKTLVLKPGKCWRRSLSLHRMSIVDSSKEACLNISSCKCQKCKIQRENSRLSRRSIKILPAPRKSNSFNGNISILESFANINNCSYVSTKQDIDVNLENSLRSLSLRTTRKTSFIHHPSVAVVTARDIVLRRCGQTEPIAFETCYSKGVLQNCQKIGEGVYGEVFLYKNQNGGTTVMKIIPIEGDQIVNGERQKKFEEILSEIIISMELSNLRNNKTNVTSSFSEVQKIQCVQGCYPEKLLELWDLFDETRGSENDSPEVFTADQLYIVLELANGGKDLEAFVFNNALQAYTMFQQVACGLAVAETELNFEHRDLHWGNILLSNVDNKKLNFRLDGTNIEINTQGVEVAIIDFTLSRIEYDGVVIFNDLSVDPDLFTAQGDYQFEIYRMMQNKNGNNWQRFEPYSNILWLHYVLDKSSNALRFKNKKSKIHKQYMEKLDELKSNILSFRSVKDFVLSNFV